jgi:hypothetical protein
MQGNPAIQRVIAKWLEDRLKPELPSGRTLGILRPFPAKYNPRNDRFFMQGNPAIQRVVAKWLEDQLKPELPSGRTLGILRPFPAKYNPRNDRFFQPDLRQYYFGA